MTNTRTITITLRTAEDIDPDAMDDLLNVLDDNSLDYDWNEVETPLA